MALELRHRVDCKVDVNRFQDVFDGQHYHVHNLVYIDNIIIYSKDVSTHIKEIGAILGLIAKSGITMSLTKCHLAYQSLIALGHTVSNLGIDTADGTVKAVKEFPVPKSVKQLTTLSRTLCLLSTFRSRIRKDCGASVQPVQERHTLQVGQVM